MTLRVLNPRHVEGGLTGKHVLGMLLAFFGLIFAVNGWFMFEAIHTYTGIVAKEPYRQGLEYNKRISEDARQTALGWKDNLVVTHDGNVALELVKHTGEPVKGLIVSGTITRPATSDFDRPLTFTEKAGSYIAEAGRLAEGNWVVEAVVRAAATGEPIYRLRKRIWLKP